MSFWNTLNPKIRAQVLAFGAIAVATLGAAALGKLGATSTAGVLVAALVTIVVGYLKSASALENNPPTS